MFYQKSVAGSELCRLEGQWRGAQSLGEPKFQLHLSISLNLPLPRELPYVIDAEIESYRILSRGFGKHWMTGGG